MVFKLVEKLASTSLGSIPNSNVSRNRSATKSTRNKRKPGLIPAYERWLIPGCTLWIVEIDNQPSHDFTLSFLSEEETQGIDLSSSASIMVRAESLLDSSFQQNLGVYVSDTREIPTTVINGKRLSSGQEVKVLPGDSIMFGRTPSLSGVEFKLVEMPLKFCLSSKSSEKIKFIDKERLQNYGIEFSTEWKPDSTHLLMDQFRVTSKIFQCLALRRPVVNYQWVIAAVDVYLNSEGSDFPPVAEYLPNPDIPSAKNRLNVTDANILLPNEARATILVGTIGFTCPGLEAELIMGLVTNCGGDLSVIPSHLIRGSAQELMDFITQKWQEKGLEEFAPVLYAPSQVCADWSSLIGLEQTVSKQKKAWYTMSMIELCQRVIYVNKLNPTTLPKPPSTHQIKAEPEEIPSQSSESSEHVIIKGNIFKPRRAKPVSSSQDFDYSQMPVRCKTKLASLVNSGSPVAGSVNCKQFKKTRPGSGTNYRAIPTLVPLVPLHQIRPSQVISKVDPLDADDF